MPAKEEEDGDWGCETSTHQALLIISRDSAAIGRLPKVQAATVRLWTVNYFCVGCCLMDC